MQIEGFKDIVKQIWEQNIQVYDSAKRITAKFMMLGKVWRIGLKIFLS